MATFYIFGKNFNPDDFLKTVKLKPSCVKYLGESRHKQLANSSKMTYSYVAVDISKAKEKLGWEKQTQSVIKFLAKNRKQIQTASELNGIDVIGINLLHSSSSINGGYQSFYIDKELIKLCGELGLYIEVSSCPPEEN